MQIIQDVIVVTTHKDVDRNVSFTIFNINLVNILLKQAEESRIQTTCNFSTLVPVVVTLCRLIHVAERDDSQQNLLRSAARAHECSQQQSPLVCRLLSPLEGQSRTKSNSVYLGETGGETLALSVQARDTLIFDQDPDPIPGCVHSNNLDVLPAPPLGPVTRVIHPGRHEG